jgi:hypothetical protein
LHNHCFRPKREAEKLAFAHFNNLKQNFRWRPQFTDQRQQISHLFSPGVNSRAELVPLATAYARKGASRHWLGDELECFEHTGFWFIYERTYEDTLFRYRISTII